MKDMTILELHDFLGEQLHKYLFKCKHQYSYNANK
jgi:hypothetical protein